VVDTPEFIAWKQLNGISMTYPNYQADPSYGESIGLVWDEVNQEIAGQHLVYDQDSDTPPETHNILYVSKPDTYYLCRLHRKLFFQESSGASSSHVQTKEICILQPTHVKVNLTDQTGRMGAPFLPGKYYKGLDAQKIWVPLNMKARKAKAAVKLTLNNEQKVFPLSITFPKGTDFDIFARFVEPLCDINFADLYHYDYTPETQPRGFLSWLRQAESFKHIDLSQPHHLKALAFLQSTLKITTQLYVTKLTIDHLSHTYLDHISGIKFHTLHLDHTKGSITPEIAAQIDAFIWKKGIRKVELDLGDKHFAINPEYRVFFDYILNVLAPFVKVSQDFVGYIGDDKPSGYKTDADLKKHIDCYDRTNQILFTNIDTGKWNSSADSIIRLIERNKDHLTLLNFSQTDFDRKQRERILALIPQLKSLNALIWNKTSWQNHFWCFNHTLCLGKPQFYDLAEKLATLPNLKEVTLDVPMLSDPIESWVDGPGITLLEKLPKIESITLYFKPIEWQLWIRGCYLMHGEKKDKHTMQDGREIDFIVIS
jgi:hypothetical protein